MTEPLTVPAVPLVDQDLSDEHYHEGYCRAVEVTASRLVGDSDDPCGDLDRMFHAVWGRAIARRMVSSSLHPDAGVVLRVSGVRSCFAAWEMLLPTQRWGRFRMRVELYAVGRVVDDRHSAFARLCRSQAELERWLAPVSLAMLVDGMRERVARRGPHLSLRHCFEHLLADCSTGDLLPQERESLYEAVVGMAFGMLSPYSTGEATEATCTNETFSTTSKTSSPSPSGVGDALSARRSG